MITKLGNEIYQNTLATYQFPNVNKTSNYTSILAKCSAGTELYISPQMKAQQPQFGLLTSISNTSTGWAFGTGTTPATEDDYTMESIISSGITIGNSDQLTIDTETGKRTYTIIFTLNNTTGSDIEVSEIGYFASAYGSNEINQAYSTSLERSYMLIHEVLEEAVTVPANDSAVIRIDFEFNSESE